MQEITIQKGEVKITQLLDPMFVTKASAAAFIGRPNLVERMLWATRHTPDQWLEIVHNREGNPKLKTLIYFPSLRLAGERIRLGEVPPRIGKVPNKAALKLSTFAEAEAKETQLIEPMHLTKESAGAFIGCPKFIERMLWATRHTPDQWLEIVPHRAGSPKLKTLIFFPSLKLAGERMRRGEMPPRIGKVPNRVSLELAA